MTDTTGWRCPKCGDHYFTHGFERHGGSPICPPTRTVDLADVFGYGPSAPGWKEPSHVGEQARDEK